MLGCLKFRLAFAFAALAVLAIESACHGTTENSGGGVMPPDVNTTQSLPNQGLGNSALAIQRLPLTKIPLPQSYGTIWCATQGRPYPCPGLVQRFPRSIVAGGDGSLWFTEFSNAAYPYGYRVTRYIARMTTSGSLSEHNIGTGSPDGIAWGSDDAIWFTEESGSIARLSTSGTFTLTTYPVGLANSIPWAITSGADHALWATDENLNVIWRMTTLGHLTAYRTPSYGSARDIVTGPDGAMWFTELQTGKIGRITTSGAVTEYKIPSTLALPYHIAVGPDGALWFTELNDKIGRITTTDHKISEFHVPTSNSYPTAIARHGSELWFIESSSAKFARITTTGLITEYSLAGSWAVGTDDNNMVLGSDGALWFADDYNSANSIDRVAPPL